MVQSGWKESLVVDFVHEHLCIDRRTLGCPIRVTEPALLFVFFTRSHVGYVFWFREALVAI